MEVTVRPSSCRHGTSRPRGWKDGALWTWSGTNLVGEPFELIGIAINEYDEMGLETRQFDTYPYPGEYVEAAFGGP